MANNIKGLTVEIGGDTTKLGKALEDVNKKSRSLSGELGQVNRLLKMDPGNTELIAQKQKILAEAIENTKAKLEKLRAAQAQVQEQFEAGGITEEQYRALQREIIATEQKLNGYENALDETSEAMDDLEESTEDTEKASGRFGEALKKAAKAGVAAVAAAGAAALKLGKSVVSEYADYEQLVGGVEKLFGDASSKVQQYADNAYKSAGLSANDYMETVTSFSASLISSLEGDTEKAADYADMAITDMADNANTFGSSISDLQNAYSGFAKQNYTMLDNLKLGYSGSKEGMEQLLKDAEAISGIHYDISSYADVVAAIHAVQENMNIAGTTAREAEKTISGSISTLQGAISNLVAGLGNADADVSALMGNVVTAFQNVVTNITPVVQNIINALPQALNAVLAAIAGLLPDLLTTVTGLISSVLALIVSMLPSVVSAAVDGLLQIAQSLVDMAPELLAAILEIVVNVIGALAEALPGIIETIVGMIPVLIETLLTYLPDLIEASITLLMALIDAIPTIIKELTKALPKIITKITSTLIANLPLLIKAAIQLFMGILKAIPTIIKELAKSMPQIISAIVKGLGAGLKSVTNVGKNLIAGLWQGISDKVQWLKDKISGFASSVLDSIKSFFGVHSPSTKTAWIGEMLDRGLADGVLDNMDDPINAMERVTSGVLDAANNVDGLSLERNIQATTAAAAGSMFNDGSLSIKLDRILNAIEAGKVIALDGDTFVGATVGKYDAALGQRRLLAERGAL